MTKNCAKEQRFICELPGNLFSSLVFVNQSPIGVCQTESEWAEWSSASWSVCDAACGFGTKFRERKCRDIGGKRTCPMAETLGREEKQCTLGPCKGFSDGYVESRNNYFFSECCSKVYIAARGVALKAQYNLLGDYYQMTHCAELEKKEGCDAGGGYTIIPLEMEVAPRFRLFTLLTLLTWFTVLTQSINQSIIYFRIIS